MKIKTLLFTALSTFSLFAVELQKNAKMVTVKTAYYTVKMPVSLGYEFSCKGNGKEKIDFLCHTTLYRNEENLKFRKNTSGRHPTPLYQPRKTSLKILENTKGRVRISIKRNYGINEVTQEYIFEESPVIHTTTTLHFKNILHKVVVSLSGKDEKELIFLPDGKRVYGFPKIEDSPAQGGYARGEFWRAILDTVSQKGYGIIAVANPHFAGVEYQSSEKWQKSNHRILVDLVYNKLSDLGKNGSFTFKFAIIAGATEKMMQDSAAKITREKIAPKILSMEMEKVVTAPGEKNRVTAEIFNPNGTVCRLNLEGSLFFGLATEQKIPGKEIVLNPGERKKYIF